jgi:hypothetical protein
MAFSLTILFTAIITESSEGARDIFTQAQERNRLIDAYQAGQFIDVRQPYGNDRYEETMTVGSSTRLSNQNSLQYLKVSTLPFANLDDAAGTPLCSIDFSNHDTLGAYASQDQKVSAVPIITPIRLPIDPLLPLTHLQVRNGIAYVSTDSATASDPDLIIVNIQNVNDPVVLSSINTGPGIASFTIAGKRIYAAADSTAAQLHVIRMDSLSSLALEKKFKLLLPYATATSAVASSIFYDRGRIYLGTTKWDGDEFNIIDVYNPTAPVKSGGLEIGSVVNDIYVNDSLAYTASADMDQFRVVNVNNPVHPMLANAFVPTGWQRQEGKTVSIFESALNYGRTSGGYNMTQDHEAFTWATTSSSTLANPISIDIPGGVYGIVADRFHIFLANRQLNRELQIYDRSLAADLDSIATSSYSLPVAPQSMTCDNDKIYVLAHTGPYIYQITFK